MGTECLPERVEGPRLVLRRWTVDDLDLLADAVTRNLDHLRPWMPWIASEPLAVHERRGLLESWEREWLGGGEVVMGIFEGGEVVGGSGLHRRRGPDGLEIGYWVDCAHLGKGIATETAAMLTTAALALEEISFVEIHHDKANVRSRRVPERLGFVFLGESAAEPTAPSEIGIGCRWQMTEEHWLER